MNTSLPRYSIGREEVEAFPILAIEFPDIGVRLCGPDGLRHGVRNRYLRDHRPYVGGYYLRIGSENEYFLDAREFERYYKPVEHSPMNSRSLFAWPYLV
jgi:hypothetical protein